MSSSEPSWLNTTTALIMAGGQSRRMRERLGSGHKALIPVLGIPMIERNFCSLLSLGFKNIVIATNVEERAINDFACGRARALASKNDATVGLIQEHAPLGTIGAARQLAKNACNVLVTNVDNLTDLNLARLVESHVGSASTFTIASHKQNFRIPFGRVRIVKQRVVEYKEKYTQSVAISSGIYVLNAAACEAIPRDVPFNIPDLFHLFRQRGEPISAYEHSANWIDVNDPEALVEAERIIADNLESFESWKHTLTL